MLDDVAAQNHVERPRLERNIHRLDIADEHTFAIRLGSPRRFRIELEADERVAARGKRRSEVAARAADVEHALPAPDSGQQLCVRAVAAFVQRDIARHRGLYVAHAIAASTRSATSSAKLTVGVQPSRSRAFDASPTT